MRDDGDMPKFHFVDYLFLSLIRFGQHIARTTAFICFGFSVTKSTKRSHWHSSCVHVCLSVSTRRAWCVWLNDSTTQQWPFVREVCVSSVATSMAKVVTIHSQGAHTPHIASVINKCALRVAPAQCKPLIPRVAISENENSPDNIVKRIQLLSSSPRHPSKLSSCSPETNIQLEWRDGNGGAIKFNQTTIIDHLVSFGWLRAHA